jgi:hypothetical protein
VSGEVEMCERAEKRAERRERPDIHIVPDIVFGRKGKFGQHFFLQFFVSDDGDFQVEQTTVASLADALRI